MTDLEKFVILYASVGIELEVDEYPSGYKHLVLEVGTPHVEGYAGFVTEIIFNFRGKFIRQDIWE